VGVVNLVVLVCVFEGDD